jgi:hypothetical protein
MFSSPVSAPFPFLFAASRLRPLSRLPCGPSSVPHETSPADRRKGSPVQSRDLGDARHTNGGGGGGGGEGDATLAPTPLTLPARPPRLPSPPLAWLAACDTDASRPSHPQERTRTATTPRRHATDRRISLLFANCRCVSHGSSAIGPSVPSAPSALQRASVPIFPSLSHSIQPPLCPPHAPCLVAEREEKDSADPRRCSRWKGSRRGEVERSNRHRRQRRRWPNRMGQP